MGLAIDRSFFERHACCTGAPQCSSAGQRWHSCLSGMASVSSVKFHPVDRSSIARLSWLLPHFTGPLWRCLMVVTATESWSSRPQQCSRPDCHLEHQLHFPIVLTSASSLRPDSKLSRLACQCFAHLLQTLAFWCWQCPRIAE